MRVYIDVYNDFDFEHLDMTSQARDNLNIIKENDKIDEFVNYLEYHYDDMISEDELSDLLHHDWETVFDYLKIEY